MWLIGAEVRRMAVLRLTGGDYEDKEMLISTLNASR